VDTDLGHLREVPLVAEMEREPEPAAFGQLPSPAGLLRGEPDDAGGALGIQAGHAETAWPRLLRRRGHRHDLEQKLDMIASGRDRAFLHQALDRERAR